MKFNNLNIYFEICTSQNVNNSNNIVEEFEIAIFSFIFSKFYKMLFATIRTLSSSDK